MKIYPFTIFLLLLISCTNKDNSKIIGFKDTPYTIKAKKGLEERRAEHDYNMSIMFFSKDHYHINDTLAFKLFLALNSLEKEIQYPLVMSYAYDTTASRLQPYEHNWKPVDIVIKDTGYCQIPIKNIGTGKPKHEYLYGRIILHLKNGKDSIFMTPQIPLWKR